MQIAKKKKKKIKMQFENIRFSTLNYAAGQKFHHRR